MCDCEYSPPKPTMESPCSKCGHYKATVVYHPAGTSCRVDHRGEHLCLTCALCGFRSPKPVLGQATGAYVYSNDGKLMHVITAEEYERMKRIVEENR